VTKEQENETSNNHLWERGKNDERENNKGESGKQRMILYL
jgi:hypothetical protein